MQLTVASSEVRDAHGTAVPAHSLFVLAHGGVRHAVSAAARHLCGQWRPAASIDVTRNAARVAVLVCDAAFAGLTVDA